MTQEEARGDGGGEEGEAAAAVPAADSRSSAEASSSEEEEMELKRPRPTERYWNDYDDWKTHHPSAIECFERFTEAANGKLLTVFLDYDGTISPIVSQPEKAYMSDEMRTAVQRVAALYPTAIISGRSREKVFDFVRIPELYYAGSHGLDIVGPSTVGEDGEVIMAQVMHQPAPWAPAVMDAVYQVCLAGIADIPGASVDHNKFCVSVHYRNCEPKEWGRVLALVDAVVETDPGRLKKAEGRKVFEVKPRVAWDKGKALSYLLGCLRLEEKGIGEGEVLSLYFGDDHTDEDAFHELKGFPNGAGCGVIVSSVPKPSNASFSVKDPAEVLLFLNSIAELAEKGLTKTVPMTVAAGPSGGVKKTPPLAPEVPEVPEAEVSVRASGGKEEERAAAAGAPATAAAAVAAATS